MAYFDISHVIDKTLETATNHFTDFVDRDNSSCVLVERSGKQWLQAIFMFHESMIDREIDIEIVTKTTEDCSSVSWTWFAESSCIPDSFTECRKFFIGPTDYGGYARCIIKCVCMPTCNYVYLTYLNVPGEDQSGQQLCDVYLLYGTIKPEARGLLP